MQRNSTWWRWKKLLLCAGLVFMHVMVCHAQRRDDIHAGFQAYRQAVMDDYNRFRKKANEDYVAFLRKTWKEYDLMRGMTPHREPKPDVAPEAPAEEDVEIPQEITVEQPLVPPPAPPAAEPEEEASPEACVPPAAAGKTVSVSFYGITLRTPYDMKPVRLREINGQAVAGLWEYFSKTDFLPLLQTLDKCSRENRLNDWALYELIACISAHIPELQGAEAQLVFRQFLLVQCGYDVRMGIRGNRPVLLTPVREKVYACEYLEYQGTAYYIMEDQGAAAGMRIRTMDAPAKAGRKSLTLQLDQSVHLGYAAHPFTLQYQDFTLKGSLNRYRMDFFKHYPQTELSVYARATMDTVLNRQLIRAFREPLAGKNTEEALAWILRFVQYAFDYQTDDKQFGYEKPFFAEELFHYPFSDCEDRAILFARLTRNLLNLDVILLDYPNHVAAAVRIDTDREGYGIRFDNRKYLICDPTYIGGKVGECMSMYKNIVPKVIEMKNAKDINQFTFQEL
ncbi:MAG: hypothetical protein LBT78_07685 [Tannerella sp.]|jgi:hypothetical protein|nr:hypothetical protein [Tannerella sp.]